MANFDFRDYIVAAHGPWYTNDPERQTSYRPDLLRLSAAQDAVSLNGPLRIRITVQAHNTLIQQFPSGAAIQTRDVFSYVLDIPPGQVWNYPHRRTLAEPGVSSLSAATGASQTGLGLASSGTTGESRLHVQMSSAMSEDARFVGANVGYGITIRPAGQDCCEPPVPQDPCAPKKECHCNCKPCKCSGGPDDLPCDFAVGGHPDLGAFFPAACEPCNSGASIGMPALKGPTLIVPPARGGTVRTRYFNGMFITREDLETDQRNNRLKHSLMNRAMGQGVVWGLNVCLDGDTICVLPGYGVDCCGNDIVIASTYRVDADALVRDPAARALLARGGPQRVHLLLEYYECPEQPRPVHGDPCGPDNGRCEMSRIRETARLRLVPPCDVDDSGPIKTFLDGFTRSSGQAVTGGQRAPSRQTTITVPHRPLTVRVETIDPVYPRGVTINSLSNGGEAQDSFILVDPQRVRIQVLAPEGYTFAQANLSSGVSITVNPRALQWEVHVPAEFRGEYQINYRLQVEGGLTISDTIWLRLEFHWGLNPEFAPLDVAVRSRVSTQTVQVQEEQPFPCFSEACDSNGTPRFPTTPPSLHANPWRTGTAADPRVVLLAIFHAWVNLETARHGSRDSDTGQQQRQLAERLYEAARVYLLGDAQGVGREQLSAALQRLLQDWCRSLLYPGPQCRCEPHGVVIGCARVEGDRIHGVDPWGGRRWVMHYPLLAHWGQQFGVMPLDAVASKLFGMLCCVAHHPTVAPFPAGMGGAGQGWGGGGGGGAVPSGSPTAPAATTSQTVQMGSAHVAVGAAPNVVAGLRGMGIQMTEPVAVGPLDFASLSSRAMQEPPVAPTAGQRFTHYTLAGEPSIHLFVPMSEQLAQTAPPMIPEVRGATAPQGRLQDLTRTAAGKASRGMAPLLRSATERLASEVLRSIPVVALGDRQLASVSMRMPQGESLGGLLDRDPEELFEKTLDPREAHSFNDLLLESEKVARKVVDVVEREVAEVAAQTKAPTLSALKNSKLEEQLTEALVNDLKGVTLDRERLAATIARAMGPRSK